MGEKNKTTDNSMSLSKQRKLARKKEIAQMKRNKVVNRVVGTCVVVALVAGIGYSIGYKIYRNATKVVASKDYSQGLTEEGLIKDVTAKDYVTLCDYNNIKVTTEDVDYTEEDLAKDIKTLVDAKAKLDKETDAAIVDKDKVNIDYVGKIDGEAFEGGDTQKEGQDVTIGSGSLIDDFEQQLIGHKIGDTFNVDVTFPAEYENEPSLAGKDATFEVTINGIYVSPEFDDAFVKENLSDKASTAEEYKAYLKDKNYNEKLDEWLDEYLDKNSEVKEYPESYIKDLKSVQKLQDYYAWQYMNSMFEQYGATGYPTFEKYIKEALNKSEAKYDKDLAEEVKPDAKKNLIYQAIFETEGLTVTEDDCKAYLETQGQTGESYDNSVTQYGKGYLMQETIKNKVLETIKTKIQK
ncbi:MAG: FKBP-type peptidyl-prolyl cis-trans isomerase [Clostridiales bacterium]|nr:FKBP-type peptidyl-prolyl cis-trans isomerase [Clostridiales bacterium]